MAANLIRVLGGGVVPESLQDIVFLFLPMPTPLWLLSRLAVAALRLFFSH